MVTVRVPLSHGLWRDGEPLLDAELCELTGTDEESLARVPENIPAAARVSELLACTIAKIGLIDSVTAKEAADLTVGDRERLLLHLYAQNFAPNLRLRAQCRQCGEQIDADVAVADLLVANRRDPRPDYELSTQGSSLRFRLPRGRDQEAAGTLARRDIAAACNLLIENCIIEGAADTDALDELEQKFAELDPQAETVVHLVCPLCTATSDIFVDAATLVFEQLAPAARLLDEVDSIARSYHWSEREILALPTARRRAYLERICEAAAVV